MTFWKSRHFKALQTAWYQRLQDDGFRDAERFVGEDLALKLSASSPYRDVPDSLDREMQELYYVVLGQRAHAERFSNEVDRLILIWYADGKKINVICAELERLGERRCRGTIRYTIRKYEMRWGMKSYTRKQLNRKD